MSTTTEQTKTLTATVSRKWDGEWTEFGELSVTVRGPEDVAAFHRSVYAMQEQGGNLVRLNWDAEVALIKCGARGVSWDELRDEVNRQLRDGERGDREGCGISSSDMNHMIVGEAGGHKIVNPEEVA